MFEFIYLYISKILLLVFYDIFLATYFKFNFASTYIVLIICMYIQRFSYLSLWYFWLLQFLWNWGVLILTFLLFIPHLIRYGHLYIMLGWFGGFFWPCTYPSTKDEHNSGRCPYEYVKFHVLQIWISRMKVNLWFFQYF